MTQFVRNLYDNIKAYFVGEDATAFNKVDEAFSLFYGLFDKISEANNALLDAYDQKNEKIEETQEEKEKVVREYNDRIQDYEQTKDKLKGKLEQLEKFQDSLEKFMNGEN